VCVFECGTECLDTDYATRYGGDMDRERESYIIRFKQTVSVMSISSGPSFLYPRVLLLFLLFFRCFLHKCVPIISNKLSETCFMFLSLKYLKSFNPNSFMYLLTTKNRRRRLFRMIMRDSFPHSSHWPHVIRIRIFTSRQVCR